MQLNLIERALIDKIEAFSIYIYEILKKNKMYQSDRRFSFKISIIQTIKNINNLNYKKKFSILF
jgi:hypothetical protein